MTTEPRTDDEANRAIEPSRTSERKRTTGGEPATDGGRPTGRNRTTDGDRGADREPSRRANWAVAYDVEPIRIRDPVAEALAVLEPGRPFEIDYEDAVVAAGHSCPTAAGAYRIAQVGLDALYPDDLPVRSEVEVFAAGPETDPGYGVTGRLLSYVTGAAGAGGFGGLAGGVGDRRDLLSYDAFETDAAGPTVRFRRTDTGRAVEVTYRVGDVPAAGPGVDHLPDLVAGTADDEERAAFREAWYERVRAVLRDDALFDVAVLDEGEGGSESEGEGGRENEAGD
ncbi:MAG: hypothetical protein ABEJ26_12895 [Halosimplex sp.]